MQDPNYLHLSDAIGTIPSGGFRYKSPNTGLMIEHAVTISELVSKVQRHDISNGFPPTAPEIIEDQLCRNLPPEQCKFQDGAKSDVSELCQVTAEDLIAGAKAVASLVWETMTGGDPWVSQEEAERRAWICARCPKNVQTAGCASCLSMELAKKAVASLKCDRTTSQDWSLQSCCVCECECKIVTHVRLDILHKGFTERQRSISPPICWKLDDE